MPTINQQFLNATNKYRFHIQKEIESYLELPIFKLSPPTLSIAESFHKDLMSDYPIRSRKFIRGTLVVLTAMAMGAPAEITYRTAAAMEVSQDWMLIHDDLEDGSLIRRGESSLYIKYSPSLAINAGDALHIMMWRMLLDNKIVIGGKKTFGILDEFVKILERTALGQTADLMFAYQKSFDFSEEDYYFIIDGKSGYYTIAGPLRLGAILAIDNNEELQNNIFPLLNVFGWNLGRAFQITDDVLDITSNFRGLKQKRGNDIYESKPTLMLAHLLAHVDKKEKEQVVRTLLKPRQEKAEDEVEYIIKLMNEYDSIEYGKQKAKQFAQRSFELFDQIDFFDCSEAKKDLRSAIDFIVNRDF